MQREDMTEQHNDSDGEVDMRLRRITLADGRYMIFYTFDEAHADRAQATAATATATEEEQQDV